MRIARPPLRGRRAAGTAKAFASSSRSWTSAAHAAPASSTSARNTRWSPATAPVCAAAARAPAADAPTFSTATPTPSSAHTASASHSRAPSPSASISSAIDRTPSSRASTSTQSGVVTHGFVPARDRGVQPQPAPRRQRVHDQVAALRDERDVPRLRRGERVAPQRRARVQRDQPVAVRPADRQRVAPRGLAELELQRQPVRASRRTRRRRRPRRRSRARRPPRSPPARRPPGSRPRPRPARPGGRSATGSTAGRRPPTRRGLTPHTSPVKPSRCVRIREQRASARRDRTGGADGASDGRFRGPRARLAAYRPR